MTRKSPQLTAASLLRLPARAHHGPTVHTRRLTYRSRACTRHDHRDNAHPQQPPGRRRHISTFDKNHMGQYELMEAEARRLGIPKTWTPPGPDLTLAPKKIAIVGGGLAGLAAAYYIAKLGPQHRVVIYEASDRLGGWVRTDKLEVDVNGVGGMVSFERGPRTLQGLNRKNQMDDLVLCDLIMDLRLKLHAPATPNLPRFIYHSESLTPVPPSRLSTMTEYPFYREAVRDVAGFAATKLYRQFVHDKTFKEAFQEDLSVAQFISKITLGGGKGLEPAASAMMHGIWGGTIDKLSARSALGMMWYTLQLPGVEKGRQLLLPQDIGLYSIDFALDDAVKMFREKGSPPVVHFGTSGMQGLTDAMVDVLRAQPNVQIRLQEPVKKIAYNKTAQKVEVAASSNSSRLPESFDKVIATVSGEKLAPMTGDKLPSLAGMHSVSIMAVSIWYPFTGLKPHGLGYLIPASTPFVQNPERALGVFFDSHVGVRGPDEPDGTKLTVLMGGHYYDWDPDRNGPMPIPAEDEAIHQAKTLLARHLGIPADSPCFATARLARDCIPQHNVGHLDKLRALGRDLALAYDGRLAVAGGSYSRIGVVPALRAGFGVARATVSGGDGKDVGRWTGIHPTRRPPLDVDVHTEIGIPALPVPDDGW